MEWNESYQLLAHYNKFGAEDSTILEDILRHGDLNFQIGSRLSSEASSLKGYTALHIALSKGDYEIFRVLIQNGADFSIKDAKGATVLHQAFKELFFKKEEKNMRKFINLVLSAHVIFKQSKNPCDNHGISHFHVACVTNRVDAVELFLQNGVSPNETVGMRSNIFPGFTALHFAAKFSCVQTVEILLDRGANVHARDYQGLTPLHLLIMRNMQIVDWNFKEDDDLRRRFKMEFAINETTMKMLLEKFIDNNGHLSKFQVACCFRDASIPTAQLSLQQSTDLSAVVDVNAPLWPGYTSLHFAAHFNAETVVLLLANKANLLTTDDRGTTALHLCSQRHRLANLHRFVDLDPSTRKVRFTQSRIRLADAFLAMTNEKRLIDFLRNVADINMSLGVLWRVWPGYTLLHLAVMLPEREQLILTESHDQAEMPYLDRLKLLLDRGADVGAKDCYDSTPLHLAFRLKKRSAVNLLLEYHAELSDSIDNDNLSYLHVACAVGNETALKSLLDKGGALVNRALANRYEYFIRDEDDEMFAIDAKSTPLHIAVSAGRVRLVELLVNNYEADVQARDANGLTPLHQVLMKALKGKRKLADLQAIAGMLLLPRVGDLQECHTSFGLSHLHVASFANDVAAIDRLLANGTSNLDTTILTDDFSLDEQFRYLLSGLHGYTSLHIALKYDCMDAVAALVRRGSKNFAVDGELLKKHSDFMATTLIDEIVSTIDPSFGLTPLHAACAMLDVEKTKGLLAQGANINEQVRYKSPLWPGYTPLHFLIIERTEYPMDTIWEIMEMLLKRRANIMLTNLDNNTSLLEALYRAINSRGSFKFPLELFDYHFNYSLNPENNDGWSHFHAACYCKLAGVARKFLKRGFNPNQPIGYMSNIHAGFTPIHLAAHVKDGNMVKTLLEYGADIHARNVNGRTPYHEAENYVGCRLPYPKRTAALLLLQAGADKTCVTPRGESAIELLLKSRKFTQELCSEYYGSVRQVNFFNQLSGEGYIAMAISHETDFDDLSENLIYMNVIKAPEKNGPDILGRTPIHNVVSIWQTNTPIEVYIQVIEELVDLGFDIDHQDIYGRTALHCATKFRNYTAIRGLLAVGSDIDIIDINRETPFSYMWQLYKNSDLNYHSMKENDRLVLNANYIHIYKMRQGRIRSSHINAQIRAALEKSLRFVVVDVKKLENEMMKLKSRHVDSSKTTTLWDFLAETCAVSSYQRMTQQKRQAVDNFFLNNGESLREEFPMFCGLLLLQYRKAVNRVELLEPAKYSFNHLTENIFPYLCSDNILTYLDNKDLEDLTKLETLSSRKCSQSTNVKDLENLTKFETLFFEKRCALNIFWIKDNIPCMNRCSSINFKVMKILFYLFTFFMVFYVCLLYFIHLF